jgi:hypothetical protein
MVCALDEKIHVTKVVCNSDASKIHFAYKRNENRLACAAAGGAEIAAFKT